MLQYFDHYVFDLDNTLYSAGSAFFDLQMHAMSDFIVDQLRVTQKEADFLRDDYYQRFGTTGHGLFKYHNIDLAAYFAAIDSVPLGRLVPDPELINLLNRLKINNKHLSVFTNGTRFHAKRVMKKLDLAEVITDVVTLECTGLIPKPKVAAYYHCFDALKIDPKHAIFFEDSSHNLITAKELGMTTVLVNADDTAHARFIAHPEIDYFVEEVSDFLKGEFLATRNI